MGKIKELMFDVAEEVIANYLDVASLDTMDPETKEDAIYGVLEEYISDIEDADIVRAMFIRENMDGMISFIMEMID